MAAVFATEHLLPALVYLVKAVVMANQDALGVKAPTVHSISMTQHITPALT